MRLTDRDRAALEEGADLLPSFTLTGTADELRARVDALTEAGLAENEQVHIWNINNGERFVTYAIRGQRGSGIISVNGSAARRASVGDLIIIAAFGLVPEDRVAGHRPKLVFVDGANRIKEERAHIPVQAASGEAVAA